MKKLLAGILVGLGLTASVAYGATVFNIQQGGTNNGNAPSLNGLIYFDGTRYTATSTQPLYVGSIIATSTATSTFSGLEANLLNITSSTASSTFANGINLTTGCFAIAGTCLSTSGGSSQWTTNGTSIYYSTGNVGIGTTTPYKKLSVAGETITNGLTVKSPGIGGNDASTVVMLFGDGADASTTFTDSSPSARTFTANGNAQLDTAQYKFGTASMLFDGTGDWIDTPDSADFSYNNNPYTIDFWMKTTQTGEAILMGQSDNTGANIQSYFDINRATANKLRYVFTDGTTRVIETTTSVNDGNWHHIAVVRNSNTVNLYVDGVSEASVSGLGTLVDRASKFAIGRLGEYADLYYNGWIDELRISFNIARWTGNFTPPTSQYTSVSDHLLVQADEDLGLYNALVLKNGSGTEVFNVKTNGKVGIATSSPWARLSINADATVGDNPIVYVASTTPPFVIGNNGGVGIGTATTNATDKLIVNGGLRVGGTANTQGTTVYITGTTYNTGYISAGGTNAGAEGVAFYARNGGNSANTASVIQHLMADSGFNQVDYAKVGGRIITNTAGSTTGGYYINTRSGGTSAERFTIRGANVGVATSTPWRTFSVTGTVAFDGLTTSTAGNAVCILANKDIVDAGGTTCTTSSIRFKDNVQTLDISAIDLINKLRPVTYDRKEKYQSNPSGKEIGFIAEEVEKVEPRFVEYEKDGVTPRAVNYAQMTALLTKALQEQQKEIEALKEEIKLLKK